MITGKNYIGNQASANGTKVFKTFNPLLNIENEWQFTEASTQEVNKAASFASEAFKTYSKFPGSKKAEFLRAIAEEIEALGEELKSFNMSMFIVASPMAGNNALQA